MSEDTKVPEAKYKIGDTVYLMRYNRACELKIKAIYFGYTFASHENQSELRWHYASTFVLPEKSEWVTEKQLFSSKEELIKTL